MELRKIFCIFSNCLWEQELHICCNQVFYLDNLSVCKGPNFGSYRFHKGFSTAHAIINLIDNIESAIDDKQFVSEVFTDLQKAFDTIDHNILLEKNTTLWYQRNSSSMV